MTLTISDYLQSDQTGGGFISLLENYALWSRGGLPHSLRRSHIHSYQLEDNDGIAIDQALAVLKHDDPFCFAVIRCKYLLSLNLRDTKTELIAVAQSLSDERLAQAVRYSLNRITLDQLLTKAENKLLAIIVRQRNKAGTF